MDYVTPSAISKLLQNQDSPLQRIFSKVQQLKQLNEVFINCLEPKLRKHCMVANIYTEKLVILVENAAIATQVRFMQPDILPLLRQKHPLLREIQAIECKVKA